MGSGDERKPYQCIEGVAIIEITGVLTPECAWWDETCYADIVDEVTMAAEDPAVTGILLRICSPGGYTDGAFECAQALAAAAKKKRMWAVADSYAYSAAYLLASQAEKIYAPPITGGVGSIGVYMAHFDYSKMLEKAGIDVTLISAGRGKTDGSPYKPLSPDAKKRFQADVDRLYGEFVAFVARGRGMSVDEIVGLGAITYSGPAALAAKLADEKGTLEDAWAALALAGSKTTTAAGQSASAANVKEQVPISMAGTPSAAMTSTKEAAEMSAEQQQKAETVQQPQPAQQQSAPATAGAAGQSDAQAISELCLIAGQPAKAAEFITKGKSLKDVREYFLNANADAQAPEIDGRAKGTGVETAKTVGLDAATNPLIAACEKLAAGMKGVK